MKKQILFLLCCLLFMRVQAQIKTYDKTLTVIINDFSEACGEDPGDAIFCLMDETGAPIKERYTCFYDNNAWRVEPSDLITDNWVLNPKYKGKKAILSCVKSAGGSGWVVEKVEFQEQVTQVKAGIDSTAIHQASEKIKADIKKYGGKNAAPNNPQTVAKKCMDLLKEGNYKSLKLISNLDPKVNCQGCGEGVIMKKINMYEKKVKEKGEVVTKQELSSAYSKEMENYRKLDKPVTIYKSETEAFVITHVRGKNRDKVYCVWVMKLGGKWKVMKTDDSMWQIESVYGLYGKFAVLNLVREMNP